VSNNRIVFEGLDELRAALRALPETLTQEASAIVDGAANAAADEIRDAYPERSGNLRNHVVVTHFEGGRFSAGAIVKNTAKHAWIFENGSQARHTTIGANRGSMPPGHVFVPRAVRYRRAMYQRLKDLLVRHGLIVSGDA
jgi:bacteriophage HK97-gp10 putative tail-component